PFGQCRENTKIRPTNTATKRTASLKDQLQPQVMSALGPKQTLRRILVMSALPPKADIAERDWHVRFVPKADILRCSKNIGYSITSSAVARRVCGIVSPSARNALRLMNSSNLTGACTGKSAGFSPLIMRLIYSADLRKISGVLTPYENIPPSA